MKMKDSAVTFTLTAYAATTKAIQFPSQFNAMATAGNSVSTQRK
jgi:hypothetical protein